MEDMTALILEAFENETYEKLKAAEEEAKKTNTRYSSKDVINAVMETIREV